MQKEYISLLYELQSTSSRQYDGGKSFVQIYQSTEARAVIDLDGKGKEEKTSVPFLVLLAWSGLLSYELLTFSRNFDEAKGKMTPELPGKKQSNKIAKNNPPKEDANLIE